jgi:hypothetical protein
MLITNIFDIDSNKCTEKKITGKNHSQKVKNLENLIIHIVGCL